MRYNGEFKIYGVFTEIGKKRLIMVALMTGVRLASQTADRTRQAW